MRVEIVEIAGPIGASVHEGATHPVKLYSAIFYRCHRGVKSNPTFWNLLFIRINGFMKTYPCRGDSEMQIGIRSFGHGYQIRKYLGVP